MTSEHAGSKLLTIENVGSQANMLVRNYWQLKTLVRKRTRWFEIDKANTTVNTPLFALYIHILNTLVLSEICRYNPSPWSAAVYNSIYKYIKATKSPFKTEIVSLLTVPLTTQNVTFHYLHPNMGYYEKRVPHAVLHPNMVKKGSLTLRWEFSGVLTHGSMICQLDGRPSVVGRLVANNSLIYPYLHYGNIVWANNNPTRLDRLFKLQKKILRIITFSSYSASSFSLFTRLGLLNKLNFQINDFLIQCRFFQFHDQP